MNKSVSIYGRELTAARQLRGWSVLLLLDCLQNLLKM